MQIIAVIQQKKKFINNCTYRHKNILHFVSSIFFGIIYNAVRTSVRSNSSRHCWSYGWGTNVLKIDTKRL